MHFIVIIWIVNYVIAFFDKISSNEVNSTTKAVKYGATRSILCALCTLAIFFIQGDNFYINTQTVLLALSFGVLMAIDLINYLFLAKTGMVALMSISNQAASLLIPTIAGIFLFSIPVNPLCWIFVATLLLSAYLLCTSSKDIYVGFSHKTVIMLVIRFFVGGLGTLTMQTFGRVEGGVTSVFLLLAYLVEAVLLLAVFLFMKRKATEKAAISKKLAVCAVASAVCTCLAHVSTVIATTYLDPVIMFSCTTVGVTVGTALVGAIFFKEKLTIKSVIGIIGACASVVIINMLG